MKKEIDILELFSGIGGFTKGFEEAGYEIKNHWFSEIDKHAIANYKYNFPNAKSIGSVTTVRHLERPDVITFGSPCQDFSLAGKRAGMDGQRSSLIREAIRLVTTLRPSVFIWENVKGTFSSNNGEDFWAIIAAFANIGGYRLEWQLLNTSWFLPQNRERIYLVGHLADRSEPGVFPIAENGGLFDNKEQRGHESETQLFATIATNTFRKESNYVVAPKIAGCLTGGGHSGGLHSDMTTIMIPHISRTEEAKELRKQSMKNGKDHTPFQGKKLEWKTADTMNTVTCATQKDNLVMITELENKFRMHRNDDRKSGVQGGDVFKESCKTMDIIDNHPKNIIQQNQIRRLTEIEFERLQGFPDDWTKFGNYDGQIKEISKTQRYKMCGNAVTVAVVKAIAVRLCLAGI